MVGWPDESTLGGKLLQPRITSPSVPPSLPVQGTRTKSEAHCDNGTHVEALPEAKLFAMISCHKRFYSMHSASPCQKRGSAGGSCRLARNVLVECSCAGQAPTTSNATLCSFEGLLLSQPIFYCTALDTEHRFVFPRSKSPGGPTEEDPDTGTTSPAGSGHRTNPKTLNKGVVHSAVAKCRCDTMQFCG